MRDSSTAGSDAIEVPASAASSSSSSPSTAPTLTFSSLLSPSSSVSSSSLTGTIGSSSATGQISPMVDASPSSSSSSSSSSSYPPLPFDVRVFIEQVKQRKLHRKFRPIPSFADYRLFSRPHNTTEAWTRLELNLAWFAVNYAAIAVLVTALAILSQPSLLLTLLLLAAIWVFALTRESIAVPGVHTLVLQGRTKWITLYALTALLLILLAGSTLLMLIGVVGSLVCTHAVLHSTPSQEERDAEDSTLEQMSVV